MARYDYVVFDFDGTVADTGEGIIKSLEYAFLNLDGKSPTREELKKYIGPPLFESFGTFAKIPEENIQSYIDKYRERYRKIGIFEVCLYDGMVDTLKTLKQNGIKLAISSSKPIKLIYDVANFLKITDLFDAITGVTFDDKNHKSKTDLIQNSLNQMGCLDKSRAVMVGDRKFDIEGANGAGVDSIGVLFGYGNREEFEEYHATYIVSEAKDIINIVLNEGEK